MTSEKMTKDEIKNRISMALKDPVLQQGFEIICKENAELSERLRKTQEQLTKAKEYEREMQKGKSFEEWKAVNSGKIEELADYFMRHDTEDYFVHDKAKDGRIIHNFEAHGETRMYGHKYNPVNEWDFRDFLAGKKMRWEKRKAAEKTPKPIKITCTEIQLKRAKKLYYALTIGFSIGYKDCKRFYLVP